MHSYTILYHSMGEMRGKKEEIEQRTEVHVQVHYTITYYGRTEEGELRRENKDIEQRKGVHAQVHYTILLEK